MGGQWADREDAEVHISSVASAPDGKKILSQNLEKKPDGSDV
jgi:hypothetical protein